MKVKFKQKAEKKCFCIILAHDVQLSYCHKKSTFSELKVGLISCKITLCTKNIF